MKDENDSNAALWALWDWCPPSSLSFEVFLFWCGFSLVWIVDSAKLMITNFFRYKVQRNDFSRNLTSFAASASALMLHLMFLDWHRCNISLHPLCFFVYFSQKIHISSKIPRVLLDLRALLDLNCISFSCSWGTSLWIRCVVTYSSLSFFGFSFSEMELFKEMAV
jgi:hypothetical protein